MGTLSGAQLSGGNTTYETPEYEFYATNPADTEIMLKSLYRHNITFPGTKFLEPSAGQGHIVEACRSSSYMPKNQEWITVDLVDRGYPLTYQADFLTLNITEKFDGIIGNPPYTYASQFIDKCVNMLTDNGLLILFLKIQFLEGSTRRELFDKYPPKYIYVCRNRAHPWHNGSPINPKTKEEWASTICFAWYIWQKGSTSEPIIRWVDDAEKQTANMRLF